MKHLFTTLLIFTLLTPLFILESHAATPAPVPQTGQTLCFNSAGTVISCAETGQAVQHFMKKVDATPL